VVVSTVVMTCGCGKVMKARASDAGKRCKCVACGTILNIPGTTLSVAPSPASSAAPVLSAEETKRLAGKTAARSAPAKTFAEDLDPIPLDDLAADLALAPPGPVIAPEFSPAPALGSRRSKPIAMSKATPIDTSDDASVLASHAALGSRPRPVAHGRGGSFHIDAKYVLIVLFFLAFVGCVLFVKMGPMAASEQWKVAQEEGDNAVRSVVTKALQAHLATVGGWMPGESHYVPAVKSLAWFESAIMIRMPDQVEVHGKTTHGKYQGFYFTRRKEVEIDMDGISGPLKVTGRIAPDGSVVAEIGGKVAELPAVVPRDRRDLR